MAKKGRKPKGEQTELQPQLDLGEPEETEEETAGVEAEADNGETDEPEEEEDAEVAVTAADESSEGESGHPGNDVAHEGEGEEVETAPEETGPKLTRLVNTKDGCWKELDDGSKVDLSEDEWRAELAHSFGRPTVG